jgi:amino acid permease
VEIVEKSGMMDRTRNGERTRLVPFLLLLVLVWIFLLIVCGSLLVLSVLGSEILESFRGRK